MKKLVMFTSIIFAAVLSSCGGEDKSSTEGTTPAEEPKSMVDDAPPAYDAKRGEGKWTEESLNLTEALNQEWATSGENISATKCTSCHKLTEERLVGPGWAGVTKKRAGAWLMNFITNPDAMIDKDPEVQAMLELCLVRMPNQNLSDAEARNIYEFMRKNDGVK
jgi:mono/diheme cytochrome c family protein